jgi:hypothetical protein
MKVTEVEQKQVGIQLKIAETHIISLFREHNGRFQHEYTNRRVMREENKLKSEIDSSNSDVRSN